jgi:multidrug resistance efflux pump
MTEIDNLVLEHLRHIRGAVDALREDMREVKSRLGRLEINLAQAQVALAEHSTRFDRLETRVERRLDLVDH